MVFYILSCSIDWALNKDTFFLYMNIEYLKVNLFAENVEIYISCSLCHAQDV